MAEINKEPFWVSILPHRLRDKVIGQNDIHAIIHNSSWLIFDKLSRLLVGIFVGSLVARYLGPSQFGILAYYIAFVALFHAVASLSLDGLVVRELVLKPDRSGEIIGTAFLLRLISGVACWILSIIFFIGLNGIKQPDLAIVALVGGGLFFQATDTIDLWFQSRHQSRRTVLVKFGAYILSSGFKVYLILSDASLVSFAYAVLLDVALSSIGLILAYQRYPSPQTWQYHKNMAKVLLRDAWPFIIAGLSIVIYMRIDQIMLKEMLGDSALGIYAAVLPLATAWQFIPMTLSISLAPYLTKKKMESEESYWVTLGHFFWLFSFLGWMVCLTVALLAPFLVPTLFGPEFQSGVKVLAICVFANLFINLGVVQGMWLVNEGLGKINLYKSIIGAVVCVVGNFLLIPHYGIIAVAIVSVISQLTSSMLLNIYFSRRIFILQVKSLFLIKKM